MERDIYDYDSKKYIDVRNQIMKDVDSLFLTLFPPKIRKLFLNEGLENHIDDFGYRWRKKESKEN